MSASFKMLIIFSNVLRFTPVSRRQCFQGINVLDITQNNINQIVVINLKGKHQLLLNGIGKTFMKIYS
jgi:hypothetical protein